AARLAGGGLHGADRRQRGVRRRRDGRGRGTAGRQYRHANGGRPVTAVSPVTARPAPLPGRRAGFGGLLRSEWTKIRSVRSTPWTLLIFTVVSLGLTGLFTWLTLNSLGSGQTVPATPGSSPTRSASSSAPGWSWTTSPAGCSAYC